MKSQVAKWNFNQKIIVIFERVFVEINWNCKPVAWLWIYDIINQHTITSFNDHLFQQKSFTYKTDGPISYITQGIAIYCYSLFVFISNKFIYVDCWDIITNCILFYFNYKYIFEYLNTNVYITDSLFLSSRYEGKITLKWR